jgi:hypothetical protein
MVILPWFQSSDAISNITIPTGGCYQYTTKPAQSQADDVFVIIALPDGGSGYAAQAVDVFGNGGFESGTTNEDSDRGFMDSVTPCRGEGSFAPTKNLQQEFFYVLNLIVEIKAYPKF